MHQEFTLLEMVARGGIIGFVVLLFSFILLVTGVVFVVMALTGGRFKPPFGIYLALAFVPLLLGIAGTGLGYMEINAVLRAFKGAPNPEEVAYGRKIAFFTTKFGIAGTLPCAVLGAAGIMINAHRKHEEEDLD
ncbi:MAG: hypothetical protein JW909_05200 [Planctomycetes bacterium]|nr:hypothetical protein [Planctomycetota bacterium]